MSILQNPGLTQAAQAFENGAIKANEFIDKAGAQLLENAESRRTTVAKIQAMIDRSSDPNEKKKLTDDLNAAKNNPS